MQINKSKKFKTFFEVVNTPRKIDFIVLHHVQADNVSHALEQFIAHGVSSHFVIDERGEIFALVDENNIAYHAGVSFWKGIEGLNKCSIGIEFVSTDPFGKLFEKQQMEAGAKLCNYLMDKYQIAQEGVVAHSDIGYERESGFLDRKQDPSEFFDWKFMAEKGVGIYPIITQEGVDEVLFKKGDEDKKIGEIKTLLAHFGYKISNVNHVFDEEMECLIRVFHRRFNQVRFKDGDVWYKSSQAMLNKIVASLI